MTKRLSLSFLFLLVVVFAAVPTFAGIRSMMMESVLRPRTYEFPRSPCAIRLK